MVSSKYSYLFDNNNNNNNHQKREFAELWTIE